MWMVEGNFAKYWMVLRNIGLTLRRHFDRYFMINTDW